MTLSEPLSGQSVLVTGGARRIGRAIALALARAGADIAITYRTSQADAETTVADIAALGRQALAIPCDVRSETSVREAISRCIAVYGRLDLVVNNAAVFGSAPLESLTLDQWNDTFETNTRGPFLVAREALPHLCATQGRIVNIGSLGGLRAWAGHAHYCASKAALHMLTLAMAKSFAPDVSVNCVAPGWIQSVDATPGIEETQAVESQAARLAARTPMGRNGDTDEVARAVLFFATGPHFITGQILAVDGGLGLV